MKRWWREKIFVQKDGSWGKRRREELHFFFFSVQCLAVKWWTASYLYWVSGGVRGHTSSVPADLQDSAQESRMDPLHTAENTEKRLLVWLIQRWDANYNIRSHLTRLHSTDLLQGRSTQLDGDVSEEAVSFCAEVSDDVRVCVRSSEELHLTFCYLKTLRQDSLHCNVASIKLTPKVTKRRVTWHILHRETRRWCGL